MKQLHNILSIGILLVLLMLPTFMHAEEQSGSEEQNTVDVKEIVFGHISDSYEWHITTWGNTHIDTN